MGYKKKDTLKKFRSKKIKMVKKFNRNLKQLTRIQALLKDSKYPKKHKYSWKKEELQNYSQFSIKLMTYFIMEMI